MSDYIHAMPGLDSIRLGWALIHFLWQGLVIALVLELLLGFVGRRNASLRYVLCGLALAAMPVCLADTYLALDRESYAAATQPVLTGATAIDPKLSQGESTGFALLPVVHSISKFTSFDISQLDLDRCLPWIVFCWVAGVLLLTGRKAGGFIVLWRLRRRGIITPSDELCHLCRNACLKIGVNPRRVYLGISSLIEVPMTMGWIRPVILFPAALLTGLSTGEIELLMAHELAHIRRCDYLVNLVQTVVESLFFYHPVTWWISRRMRQERENSCDDLVTARSAEVLAYANVLFHLESLRQPDVSLAAAANGGSLLQRIQRLADEPTPGSGRGLPLLLMALSVLGVVAAGSLTKTQTLLSATLHAGSMKKSARSTNIASSTSSRQTVIYQDNFGRKGELDGSAPTLVNTARATWTSSTGASQYATSGDAAALSPSAYGYSVAYLPVNGASKITLDGTKDFTLSVVVKPGSAGRTGISLNTGILPRYANLFTNDFAALSTSSGFAGAYAFNGGNIGYNYAPGINGPTTISLAYSASARTLTYTVGSTTVYTQTGVTQEQVAAVRYVSIGNDGYGVGPTNSAPTFNNFTFAVNDDRSTASELTARLGMTISSMLASL